jgi:hypothetical protein
MPTLVRPPIFRYFLRKDEQRRRMTRRKEKMMEPEKKVKYQTFNTSISKFKKKRP